MLTAAQVQKNMQILQRLRELGVDPSGFVARATSAYLHSCEEAAEDITKGTGGAIGKAARAFARDEPTVLAIIHHRQKKGSP